MLDQLPVVVVLQMPQRLLPPHFGCVYAQGLVFVTRLLEQIFAIQILILKLDPRVDCESGGGGLLGLDYLQLMLL